MISSVSDDDSGSYTCVAANRNHNISASCELAVLGKINMLGSHTSHKSYLPKIAKHASAKKRLLVRSTSGS